jgi:hypothetical protein
MRTKLNSRMKQIHITEPDFVQQQQHTVATGFTQFLYQLADSG